MGHIFISYSRDDSAFVERLGAALNASGREIWRDTKNMMPSADWAQEIMRALVGADTVLFVISPASIISPSCAAELAQAVENRKRIIPIVCQDVDPRRDPVPAAVARLDWVFMRPTDNFDEGMHRLTLALNTDLDYWHRGAEIAERARQWKTRNQDHSLLLRGKDLSDAEGWLVAGTTRVPPPAPFQAELIAASRRNNSRQQRRLVSGLLGFCGVVLILAVLATTFGALATQREHVALSRQYAGLANTARLRQNRPDLALLDGIAGLQQDDNADTRDSLIASLTDEPHLQALLRVNAPNVSPAHRVTALAYTPQGSALYATTFDGKIIRWPMFVNSTKDIQHTEYLAPHANNVPYISQLAVNRDDQSVAFVNGSGLWSWPNMTAGGQPKQLAPPNAAQVDYYRDSLALGYSAGTTLTIVSGCDFSDAHCAGVHVHIWDAKQGKLDTAFDLPVFATVDDAAVLSPDGQLLAVVLCNTIRNNCPTRLLVVFDFNSPSHGVVAAALMDQRQPIERLVFSQDSHNSVSGQRVMKLAATCRGDVDTCTSVQAWDLTRAPLGFASGGNPVYGVMIVPTGTPVFDVAFDKEGKRLATAGCAEHANCSSGGLQLWSLETDTPEPLTERFGTHINPLLRVAFSPDDAHIVSQQANDNELIMWNLGMVDPATDNIRHLVFPDPANQTNFPHYGTALSPDGHVLAELVDTQGDYLNLLAFPGANQPPLQHIAMPEDQGVVQVGWSDDGTHLAAMMEGHFFVWTWDGKQLTQVLSVKEKQEEQTFQYIGFSMNLDGSRIAVVNNPPLNSNSAKPGQIELWDTTTVAEPKLFVKSADSTYNGYNAFQVALSPDGKSMAAAYYPNGQTIQPGSVADFTQYFDHDISVWDVASQKLRPAVYTGHDTATGGIYYSRDGRYLASIDIFGGAAIWNTQTKKILSQFVVFQRQEPKGGINDAFSSDGRFLVFTGGEIEGQQDVIVVYDIQHDTRYVQPINNVIAQGTSGASVVNVQLTPDNNQLVYSIARDNLGDTYVRDLNPSHWVERACQVVAHPGLKQSDWNAEVGQGQPPAACAG